MKEKSYTNKLTEAIKKLGLKKRDVYLLIAIFNIQWYTIVVLILSYLERSVPESLTVAWFAAWGGELAIIAGIKITCKEDNNG